MTAFRFMFTLFSLACFVSVVGVAMPAEKPTQKKGMKEILAGLSNTDAEEAEQVSSQLSVERAELEAQLIRQLNSPKPKQQQVVIAYLLGLYRMDNAVRPLTRVITLETEPKLHRRLPAITRHPAAQALLRIGMPSIPAVMERLETTEDAQVVELGTWVIDRILGRELGEMAIKHAIDKQTDRDKRKRLEEALAFFKDKLRR